VADGYKGLRFSYLPPVTSSELRLGTPMAPMGHSPPSSCPVAWHHQSPQRRNLVSGETNVKELLMNLWSNDEGQDIAEYAVMLAVILVIVVGTIRLIGTQANNVFSQTASAIGS
jgi:Flp pilus assembly pilin Flp